MHITTTIPAADREILILLPDILGMKGLSIRVIDFNTSYMIIVRLRYTTGPGNCTTSENVDTLNLFADNTPPLT